MSQTSLRLRVVPRYPANVTATDGLKAVRSGVDLVVKSDYSSLVQVADVPNPDKTFMLAWDSDIDNYQSMSFTNIINNIQDAVIGAPLAAIDATNPGADQVIYFTGEGEAATYTSSDFVRSISNAPDAGSFADSFGAMSASVYDPDNVGGEMAFKATTATAEQGLLASSALQPLIDGHRVPSQSVWIEMFGGGIDKSAAENMSAYNQAVAYLKLIGRGGTIKFRGNQYTFPADFRLKNWIRCVADGKGITVFKLEDGANGNFITTDGYDSFADNTDRTYSYYASNTARNAASRSAGTYAMVASANNDFDNAAWSVAINTPASSDADWESCDPVVGCVSGGLIGITVDGNRENQTGDFVGGAIYGVNMTLIDCEFKSAAVCLHGESPGSVYSTIVGVNLQWTIQGLTFRDFTITGFRNNTQSDGTVLDIKSYANDDTVPTEGLIHHQQKASGQKWYGVHVWGGAAGTQGMICDALTQAFFSADLERPTQLNAGGIRIYGQAYRANDASRDEGSAFVFAGGVSGCIVVSRVNHYRYAYKFNTSGGTGNEMLLIHYSEDSLAAEFDPSSAGITYNPANDIRYLPTFSGGKARSAQPPTLSSRLRHRMQTIAYAASITPNINSGDYISVGALTGNIAINAPTGDMQAGDEILFHFLQDGTGTHTLTWDSSFHAAPTAAGSGNLRRVVKFIYTGSIWALQSDSGWVA